MDHNRPYRLYTPSCCYRSLFGDGDCQPSNLFHGMAIFSLKFSSWPLLDMLKGWSTNWPNGDFAIHIRWESDETGYLPVFSWTIPHLLRWFSHEHFQLAGGFPASHWCFWDELLRVKCVQRSLRRAEKSLAQALGCGGIIYGWSPDGSYGIWW